MLVNIGFIKALRLVLVFVAFSGTSVGGEVRQGIEQETQQNPEIRTFNQELLKKCREIENEVDVAKRQALRRQKQEHQEMAKRDEQAIERGAGELGQIRQAVVTLRNDPWVRFVEVYVTMSGFSLTAPQSSRRTSVRQYDTWSRGTPRQTLAVIDRTNAGLILAQAEQAFRGIAQTTYLPPEILDRHQRESEEYRVLEKNLLDKIKTLRLEAIRALRAVADQTELLESEMQMWKQRIDEEITAARDALERIGVAYPATRRAEPISFSTHDPFPRLKSRADDSVNLVLVVRIRPEYFIPSVEEYEQLNVRSFSRLELIVLDSRLFKLILHDGKPVPPAGFVDVDSWGGNVVFDSAGLSAPRSRRIVNHRCILGFEETVPSTMEIRIGWLLDTKAAAAPFKLQFAKFAPAPVPNQPLQPQTSDGQSQGTAPAPNVQ